MSEEKEVKRKTFNSLEECLQHYFILISTESNDLKRLYKNHSPFKLVRNRIVDLTNRWKLSSDNYLAEFIDNMQREIALIDQKKSMLTNSNKKFIIDLYEWLNHFLKTENKEIGDEK